MMLQNLHVFQFEGGHLRDVTEDFRADPTQFLLGEADVDYGPVEPELIRVEPGRVLAGRDSYRLEVQGLADLTVEIQFRMVDGGPLGVVPVSLDAKGGITYYVSDQTSTWSLHLLCPTRARRHTLATFHGCRTSCGIETCSHAVTAIAGPNQDSITAALFGCGNRVDRRTFDCPGVQVARFLS